MNSIAKHWPTIRQVTYSLLAAFGAVAVGAGWLTESQTAEYLGYLALILTTAGNVMGGFFVDRTSKAQDAKIEDAVRAGVELAAASVTPVVQDVVESIPGRVDVAQEYLDRIRVETEQRLRSLGR